jgi:uncharacterized membrane protein YgcG
MVRRLYFFVLCYTATLVSGAERIVLFDVDVVIHLDATLTVKEEISVYAAGQQIKHGIVREFPTRYTDRFGRKHVMDFVLKQVLLNGKPVVYQEKEVQNGKHVYIGNPGIYLRPNIYTFTLVYTVNRMLGFFDTHDELYWNVTGNGWRLPIDKVEGSVRLPEGIDIASVKFDGYTGKYGAVGKDMQAGIARNGAVRFKATRPLGISEGLSVVVGWPKGHVTPPSLKQKIEWFVRDNLHYVIFLSSLLFLLCLFVYIYRKNRQREGNKIVIPLFTAPDDLLPGAVNYFTEMTYKDLALSADVVQMAVRGWLTIHQEKEGVVEGFLFGVQKIYLEQKNDKGIEKFPLYQKLYDIFFAKSSTFKLDTSNEPALKSAYMAAMLSYDAQVGSFFDKNTDAFAGSFLVVVCAWMGIALLGDSIAFMIFAAVVYVLLLIGGYQFLRSYTQEGYDVKREIDGFKLFLTVAEKDRMEMVGTPPMQTPQLYETYLPYAIALGVERQWSEKFTSLFHQMQAQGTPYVPVWYIGPHPHSFASSTFAPGLSRSVSSAISAASNPPGSSSGFSSKSGSGGGFSGGGGGGGGGGGW